MLKQFTKVLVIISFLIVTFTLLYTSYNIFFNDIVYNKDYIMGCTTYYVLLIFVIYLIKSKRIFINETLLYTVVLFNFTASILGELFDFYYKFAFWDNMLHCISGIILTIIALNILYIVNDKKNFSKLNYVTIFVFLVGFTSIVSMTWETYEFFMDSFFLFNMQKSFYVTEGYNFMQHVNNANLFVAPSLVDTMGDLIQGIGFSILTAIVMLIIGPLKIINKYMKKPSTKK